MGSLALLAIPAAAGLAAADVPRTVTGRTGSRCGAAPSGDADAYPALALRSCDEPLAADAPDLRGYWTGEGVRMRIEQCGARVIFAGPGPASGLRYSHDLVAGEAADVYAVSPLPACVVEMVTLAFDGACVVVAGAEAATTRRCRGDAGTGDFDGVAVARVAPLEYLEAAPTALISRTRGARATAGTAAALGATAAAVIASWALAWAVSQHRRCGRGEPTVVYVGLRRAPLPGPTRDAGTVPRAVQGEQPRRSEDSEL